MTFQVDLSKVTLDVLKPWISKRVFEILGVEDDIVADFCFAQLEEHQKDTKPGKKPLDPRRYNANKLDV